MDKARLTNGVIGSLTVRATDVARLATVAHHLRQEIGDPRLPNYARANYVDMIQAVEDLVQNAGGEDDANA